MMGKIISIFLMLFSNLIFSQRNSEKLTVFNKQIHEKIYTIEFPDTPCRLEIIKYKNANVKSFLITYLYDKRKLDSIKQSCTGDELLNRIINGTLNCNAYDIHQINSNITDELLAKIQDYKLESLEECNNKFNREKKDCENYLHPSYANFTIKTHHKTKDISFQILALKVEKEVINQLPEKQKKAQIIISEIDKILDVEKKFNNAIQRIVKEQGEGEYSYMIKGYINVIVN